MRPNYWNFSVICETKQTQFWTFLVESQYLRVRLSYKTRFPFVVATASILFTPDHAIALEVSLCPVSISSSLLLWASHNSTTPGDSIMTASTSPSESQSRPVHCLWILGHHTYISNKTFYSVNWCPYEGIPIFLYNLPCRSKIKTCWTPSNLSAK